MDYIVSFLKYIEFEKRYSKRTVESYQIDLMQFCDFCKSIVNIEDITTIEPVSLRDWIVYLLDNGITNRSVNRKLSAVKSFYRYLQRQGIIDRNPVTKIESLKSSKRLPVFVTENKMEQVFEEDSSSGFDEIRNLLILEMFYLTGIRLSELINLYIRDIDFSSSLIKVLGKRNKERMIPITGSLQDNIKYYFNYRNQINNCESDYLFVTSKGNKLYPKLVYRIVTSALAKVTTMDKKSPHVLRHTFATHMLNNGAGINAIKEILGHANLAATQVYTHNTFEKLKKIYKQAHPRA